MARQKKRTTPSKFANDLAVSICPPAPILPGEDEKAYNELLARVSGTVKPKDAIEEILVRDIVDMTWDIFRNRGYKTRLIKSSVPTALREVLAPVIIAETEKIAPERALVESVAARRGGHSIVDDVMTRWVLGEQEVVAWVDHALDQLGLTMEDINARAMTLELNKILQIDDLLDRIERSRNALIQEIERRRAAFAEALRQATKDLDGEAQEVAADAPALEHAGD